MLSEIWEIFQLCWLKNTYDIWTHIHSVKLMLAQCKAYVNGLDLFDIGSNLVQKKKFIEVTHAITVRFYILHANWDAIHK